MTAINEALVAANTLESRERLARIVDGQVAGGHMEKSAANRLLRKLHTEAYGRSAPAEPATKRGLAAMGIQVR